MTALQTNLTFQCKVHFTQARRGRKQMAVGETPAPAPIPLGRVPRIARLIALAIRLERLLAGGTANMGGNTVHRMFTFAPLHSRLQGSRNSQGDTMATPTCGRRRLFPMMLLGTALVLAGCASGLKAEGTGFQDTFPVAKAALVNTGTSRYFVLVPGYRRT